jgi:hypothetical protein
MNITVPTTIQVADRLERTARLIAPAVAFAITITLLLMQLAYELGYQLGQAVHARNDQLSAVWVRLWAPAAEVLADAPAEAIPAATAPLQHPLMRLADELEQLTRSQLQALTGCRRKASKAQLITLALAMA